MAEDRSTSVSDVLLVGMTLFSWSSVVAIDGGIAIRHYIPASDDTHTSMSVTTTQRRSTRTESNSHGPFEPADFAAADVVRSLSVRFARLDPLLSASDPELRGCRLVSITSRRERGLVADFACCLDASRHESAATGTCSGLLNSLVEVGNPRVWNRCVSRAYHSILSVNLLF